jgi:hypothetical protein
LISAANLHIFHEKTSKKTEFLVFIPQHIVKQVSHVWSYQELTGFEPVELMDECSFRKGGTCDS